MAFLQGNDHCLMLGRDQGATQRHFQRCKNIGHTQYLTVDQLRQKKDLSDIICLKKKSSEEAKLWRYVDRTVRVVATCTSVARPDAYPYSNTPYPCASQRGSKNRVRYGTGYLVKDHPFHDLDNEIVCPCPDCKSKSLNPDSKSKRYEQVQGPQKSSSYYFEIQTAAHVVFDQSEAESAIFEFFYDSEDRSRVKCLYGVTVLDDELYRLETDRCRVLCATHDSRLAARLYELCDFKITARGLFQSKKGILASHPHGVSKRISIGQHCRGKIVVLSKTSTLRLPAGVMVNFSGCEDPTALVSAVNKSLGGDGTTPVTVIGYQNYRKTKKKKTFFRLLCDLTISYHPRMVVECDSERTCFPPMAWKQKWWRLPPEVELYTTAMNNGNRFKLPANANPGYNNGVMMEYCLKGSEFKSPLLIENSIEKLFTYYTYDVPSCPGSSGGNVIVKYFTRMPFPWFYHTTHFGTLGDCNRSGLMEDSALNCGGEEDRSLWFQHYDDDDDDDDEEDDDVVKVVEEE